MINLFIDILESNLNNFLFLADAPSNRLQKLSGKLAKIEFKHTPIALYFHFSAEKIYILQNCQAKPDVILRGTPLTFLRVWQETILNKKTKPNSDLEIMGEVEVAEALNNLLQELNINWEMHLSKIFGDVIAHHTAETFRTIKNWFISANDTLQSNLTEYLQEEKKITPSKLETDELLEEIDQLRDAVARAEARTQKIEKLLEEME